MNANATSKPKKPAIDQTTEAWAKQWRAEHIDAATNKLINQAFWDLHFGPMGADATGDPDSDWADWPGFETACIRIQAALEDLPSVMYFDTDCDEGWQLTEPEPERCEDCDGQGEVEFTDLEDEEIVTYKKKCEPCSGRGQFDPSGDWWKFERHELKNIIVGKALAEYV